MTAAVMRFLSTGSRKSQSDTDPHESWSLRVGISGSTWASTRAARPLGCNGHYGNQGTGTKNRPPTVFSALFSLLSAMSLPNILLGLVGLVFAEAVGYYVVVLVYAALHLGLFTAGGHG